jgi:hypothetical protein
MAWKKSALKPSQTFRFFAHGAFVLEPWTNAINGKKFPAPNLIHGYALRLTEASLQANAA